MNLCLNTTTYQMASSQSSEACIVTFILPLWLTFFSSDYIKIWKIVLQGDWFSPLILNLVNNTFFQQFGYQFFEHFILRHWLQFADDVVAIIGEESENQTLSSPFNRWYTSRQMIMKVEKYHSLRMKKFQTKCTQIKPKLCLNNKLINPVKIDESFVYLGRYFDFNMTNKDHKDYQKQTNLSTP